MPPKKPNKSTPRRVSKAKLFKVPSFDSLSRREKSIFEDCSGVSLRQMSEFANDNSMPIMGIENALLYIAVRRQLGDALTFDEVIDSDFELDMTAVEVNESFLEENDSLEQGNLSE